MPGNGLRGASCDARRAGGRGPPARRLAGSSSSRDRPASPLLGVPVLVEVLHGPARVAGRRQRPHPQRFVHGDRAGGRAAQTTILQPLPPVGFLATTPAAKRPLRHPEDLRRLRHGQFPSVSPLIQLFTPHLSHLLSHGRPTHPGPSWAPP